MGQQELWLYLWVTVSNYGVFRALTVLKGFCFTSPWDLFEIVPIFLIRLGLFVDGSSRKVCFVESLICGAAYWCSSLDTTWVRVKKLPAFVWIIIRLIQVKNPSRVTFSRCCCSLPAHVCVVTQSSWLNMNILNQPCWLGTMRGGAWPTTAALLHIPPPPTHTPHPRRSPQQEQIIVGITCVILNSQINCVSCLFWLMWVFISLIWTINMKTGSRPPGNPVFEAGIWHDRLITFLF